MSEPKTEAKVLGKADIFNANDLPVEQVPVPEWGGVVHVRTMTAEEKDSFENTTWEVDKQGNKKLRLENYRGRLAALCMCDARGQRIFDEDDAGELGRKSPKALDRVLMAIKSLNGLDEDDLEAAKKN